MKNNTNASLDIITAFYSLVVTIPIMLIMLMALSPPQNMVLDMWAGVDTSNPFYSEWLSFCVNTSVAWWSLIPIMIVVMAFVYLILQALRKQSGSVESVRRDEF